MIGGRHDDLGVRAQGRERPERRRFWRETRAAATALTAIVVALMTVGAGAFIIEHASLVDQRDTLKSAAAAAAIAATQEMHRVLEGDSGISDDDLKAALKPIARAYIAANLLHLPKDRYDRAIQTLVVEVRPDRVQRTVDVRAEADMGGFLFAGQMPLLGGVDQIKAMIVDSKVESETNPVEVVLAIDISGSMEQDLAGTKRLTGAQLASSSRMAIVKKAAAQLVDILEPGTENRVAIGIVPWHLNVRLASGDADNWAKNNWARYPTQRHYGIPYTTCNWQQHASATCIASLPAAVNQALPAAAPESWRGCLDEDRLGKVGTSAALPDKSDLLKRPSDNAFAQGFFPSGYSNAYLCEEAPWPADFYSQYCYKPPSSGSFDKLLWYKPYQDEWDSQPGCMAGGPTVLPLSTDSDGVEKAINDLSAIWASRTYSALGILWSLRLLQHSWKSVWGGSVHPVDPDEPWNDKVRKVIVLLTDGEDTHCGFGIDDCDDSPVGIARADACDAAKKEGVEIFVIAAMVPNKVSTELADGLRSCSSASDNPDGTYVFLNNATPENLSAAFSNIAGQLTGIRRVN